VVKSYCRQSWTWNKRKSLLQFFDLQIQNSFLFLISCDTSQSQTHPMVLESLKDTPCGTAVTYRHSLWYYSQLDIFYGTTVTHRLSLWCYRHLQTLIVVLLSARHYLWYYSHSQTLSVVLNSLTDTSCGTTVNHRQSLWYYILS
jgi:hypothetical protein